MPPKVLSAVLEPRRRAILRVLAEEDLPVGDLARRFDVSRPAISQHLAVLRAAGLVDLESHAGRNRYRIRPEGLAAAHMALAQLVAEVPGDGETPAALAGVAAPGPARAPADVALAVQAAASPERLFALVTSAPGLARWLGGARTDPRPGGTFRIDLGGGDAAAGTYRFVDAPRRVVFGWGQEGGPLAPDSSEVEVGFEPVAGGTLVRLEHRGLPAEMRAPHLGSWATHLPRLIVAAEAGA